MNIINNNYNNTIYNNKIKKNSFLYISLQKTMHRFVNGYFSHF